MVQFVPDWDYWHQSLQKIPEKQQDESHRWPVGSQNIYFLCVWVIAVCYIYWCLQKCLILVLFQFIFTFNYEKLNIQNCTTGFQMVQFPCLMCSAAGRLLAENSTVCDVWVTFAAVTAEGHRVSENRVSPGRAAFKLVGLVGPFSEVTDVLVVPHHGVTVNSFLSKWKIC